MALVGVKTMGVVGQIFEQRRRRLAGTPSGEIARIILDAGAGASRLQHFEIEQAALFEPLRFEQSPGRRAIQPSRYTQLGLDGNPTACRRVGRGVT